MNKFWIAAAVVLVLGYWWISSPHGAGGETTCQEYLAILPSLEDRLYQRNMGDADKIIANALKEGGYDPEYGGNKYKASMNVDEFCGTPERPNRQNSQRPIREAIFSD